MWFISFSVVPSRCNHLDRNSRIHSFWCLGNIPFPFMDHVAKGLVYLNEVMSSAVQCPPGQMDHSEEFWPIVIHLRREWQTTPVFLLWEPHGQCWKAERHDTRRWAPMSEVSTMLLKRTRAITNSSGKNEVTGPKQKLQSVVDVYRAENKVQYYK